MPKLVAKPLTQTGVDRLRYQADGPRIQRTWDMAVTGLAVEVSATGRKSWVLRYTIDGKQRIVTIGRVAEMPLAMARQTAIGLKSEVAQGTDPLAPVPEALTVKGLWDKYRRTRFFDSRSRDFQSGMYSTINTHLLPAVGDTPLREVTRSQIRVAVDNLIEADKEGAARGLLCRARILFNYAVENELVDVSPADHIKPAYIGTGRRDVWLKDADALRQAWWLDAPLQLRLGVRWLLLTGCRRDEARLATRDQIGPDAWRVPATKNGLALALPVMPMMQDIIRETTSTFGATPWLFPGTVDTLKEMPRSSWDWSLRKATGGAWVSHVLRHTVESHLRELGISEEGRDAVLNHVRRSTGSRYGHGEQLAIKATALTTWHHYLESIIKPA